jgi:hypothetical protein
MIPVIRAGSHTQQYVGYANNDWDFFEMGSTGQPFETLISNMIQAVNLDSDLSAGVRLGFQPGGLRLFCQCLSSCLSSLERMSSLDPLRRNFYADSKADALMMQSASSTSSTSISVHLQCNFNMWIPKFQCHNVFLL